MSAQPKKRTSAGFSRMAAGSVVVIVVIALGALSAWLWSPSETEGTSLAELGEPKAPVRGPAQADGFDGDKLSDKLSDELFITPKQSMDKNVATEALNRTGVHGSRARKVKFNSEPLRNAKRPGDRLVKFRLFSDTVFVVRFFEASPQLNRRAEFVGQVEGDPDSRVQIWATQTAINGELVTAGRTFRFVPTSGGFHYIIETLPSR